MGRAEKKGCALFASYPSDVSCGLASSPQYVLSAGLQHAPRRGQQHSPGGSFKQRDAKVILQRSNPSTEGGLSNIPRRRGAGEVSRFSQGQEVLEPDQLHDETRPCPGNSTPMIQARSKVCEDGILQAENGIGVPAPAIVR